MRKHLDHLGPFAGFFVLTSLAAAFRLAVVPTLEVGARSLSVTGLLSSWLIVARPLGNLLLLLPALVALFYVLSFRLPVLRSADFMALLGCGLLGLCLLYAFLLCGPLWERGMLFGP